MEVLEHYIINEKTMMIKPVCDSLGYVNSLVVEVGRTFIVKMKPKKLIDHSLKYYGSSYKGAVEGTKAVLGKDKVLPIVINAALDIFMFPIKSPNSEQCIWFVLAHIVDYEKVGVRETKVLMNDNYSVLIDMKKSRFEIKVNQCSRLKYIICKRSKQHEWSLRDLISQLFLSFKK